MLPLHTQALIKGDLHRPVFKVVDHHEGLSGRWPAHQCLLFIADDTPLSADITPFGFAGIVSRQEDITQPTTGIAVSRLKVPAAVSPGDVIRLNPGRQEVHILYRRGSRNNFLYATDRCNNLCLMCSQPPKETADDWRVGEMIQTLYLVDRNEAQLGITGGEPTLLGQGLADVLIAAREFLPETALHILTNGRRFADASIVDTLGTIHPRQVTWAVPLYADHAQGHDYVVQARGAFDETMQGLYHLGARQLGIEVRVVLSQATVGRLPELARFIYRNLPFVSHIALMGLEPMGYALVNRERLWVDPVDYMQALSDALFFLANRGMNVSIYNLPHCVLPETLWPFARQSISDWKNLYVPECTGCDVMNQCAGFFKSAGSQWRSQAIAPIRRMQAGSDALSQPLLQRQEGTINA